MSESRLLGPVAVLGDFNAHLGLLEGESENLQGVFLQELLDRCEVPPKEFWRLPRKKMTKKMVLGIDCTSQVASCKNNLGGPKILHFP